MWHRQEGDANRACVGGPDRSASAIFWGMSALSQKNASLFFCALTLASALAGCFYPAGRGKLMEERMSKVEQDRDDLTAELAAARGKIDEKIAEVSKALEELERAARRSGADLGIQFDRSLNELGSLRGQLEQALFRLEQLEARVAQQKSVESTPEEKAQALERPADKKGFAELVSAKLATEPKVGRALASEWLRKWPRDPLAARVHYELGSSYLSSKEWRAALGELAEVAKSFPKSEWAPGALLKSSEAFGALKMSEESRLALDEVVASYPKSAEAKTAKSRLAAMKKSAPTAPKPKKK